MSIQNDLPEVPENALITTVSDPTGNGSDVDSGTAVVPAIPAHWVAPSADVIARRLRKKEKGPKRDPWFDENGCLLKSRYTEVERLIAEFARNGPPELQSYPHHAPLSERIVWAQLNGWQVGLLYPRCSSKKQDSYHGQFIESIELAIHKKILILPELTFGDEGETGRKRRRSGFQQLRKAIEEKQGDAVVAYSVSRFGRNFARGILFIDEDIVENGMRAVAKQENFDTNDESWSDLLTFALYAASRQSKSIGDNARMGHRAKVENERLVGACTVGYYPEPIPGGGTTKLGEPQTRKAVHPRVAALIRKHYKLRRDGIKISEGLDMWNEEIATWSMEDRLFAVDPRSCSLFMSMDAYRDLLRRDIYRGLEEYGKYRSKWLSKKDYMTQELNKDGPMLSRQNERLRIVEDDDWFAVQRINAEEQHHGRRGPRKGTEPSLPNKLPRLCVCGECGHVLSQYGVWYMYCPNTRRRHKNPDGTLGVKICNSHGTVDRKEAFKRIAAELRRQVNIPPDLIEKIVAHSRDVDVQGDEGLGARMAELKRLIADADDLMQFLEQRRKDPDAGRRYDETMVKKAQWRAELETLKSQSKKDRQPLTRERLTDLLAKFDQMLANASDGKLGAEAVHEAFALMRDLTGDRITITFDQLSGPGPTPCRGTFKPALMDAVRRYGGVNTGVDIDLPEVEIVFREQPLYIRIADEVHPLLYVEKLSKAKVAKRFNTSQPTIAMADKFWHESRGLPVPVEQPLYAQIADEVHPLLHEKGMTKVEVAPLFKTSEMTILAADRHWHKIRGLPVPPKQPGTQVGHEKAEEAKATA